MLSPMTSSSGQTRSVMDFGRVITTGRYRSVIRKLDKPCIGRHRYGFDLRLCSHIETINPRANMRAGSRSFAFHDMSSLIAKWVTNNRIRFFTISAALVSGASIA